MEAKVGTQGTCIHCDEKIILYKEDHWTPHWVHSRNKVDEDDRRRHCLKGQVDPYTKKEYFPTCSPKEWCDTTKNDGRKCYRAVKHENIAAGLYACGWHLAEAVRKKEAAEANERRREEAAQREAIEAWEHQVYLEDEAAIKELWPEIVEAQSEERHYRTGWPSEAEAKYDKFKAVSLDVHALREAMDKLIERIRGEGSSD